MTTMRLPTALELRTGIINQLEAKIGILISPEFRKVIENHPKEKFILGGVQGGKSTALATEFAIAAMQVAMEVALGLRESRQYIYWIIMPSYRTPTKEMEYLGKWFGELGLVHKSHTPSGAPNRLELYGGMITIETRTAEDPAGIASESCDGIGAAEAGQMSEEILERARERTVTRNGWRVFAGTLENDQAKPQFVWYGEIGRELLDHPEPDAEAYTLPTWANLSIHPEGRLSPAIIALEERYSKEGRMYAFNRRYGGVPDGVQYPVYDDLASGEWGAGDVSGWQWSRSLNAGGYDWGEAHPSALVILNCTMNDIAVYRDVWMGIGEPDELVNSRRRLMGSLWNVPNSRWGFDPQLKLAANLEGAQAVSRASRMYRVGLVQSRLKQRKLLFDMDILPDDDEVTIDRKNRVRQLFNQMKRVHLIRRDIVGQGAAYIYDRVDDDMAAAAENCVEILDGKKKLNLGNWRNYS